VNHAGRAGLSWVLCVWALLLVAVPPSADESAPEEFSRKNSDQWFEMLRPGQGVRVVNPFGNVYARFGGYENKVEILATSQRLELDRPELEVRFSHGDERLRIEVGFSGEAADGAGTRDRVDLVIFVPEGASLDVKTADGFIEAKGLKSDLTSASVKGDMRIRAIQGRVNAKSERGAITVTLETGATADAQDFATETGDIEVWLWEDGGFNASLATSGEISTDFSLEIEHRRFEEPSKHATAIVGEGGPGLTLRSKQGRVRLLRLNKHFKPEK